HQLHALDGGRGRRTAGVDGLESEARVDETGAAVEAVERAVGNAVGLARVVAQGRGAGAQGGQGLGRGQVRVQGTHQGRHAGDVRRRHRGTLHVRVAAVGAQAEDAVGGGGRQVAARRHHVDTRAVVRVRGALAVAVGRTHDDRAGAVRGGEAARRDGEVPGGGYDDGPAGGVVEGLEERGVAG